MRVAKLEGYLIAPPGQEGGCGEAAGGVVVQSLECTVPEWIEIPLNNHPGASPYPSCPGGAIALH